jgi:hypothetical protein
MSVRKKVKIKISKKLYEQIDRLVKKRWFRSQDIPFLLIGQGAEQGGTVHCRAHCARKAGVRGVANRAKVRSLAAHKGLASLARRHVSFDMHFKPPTTQPQR